MSFEYDFIMPNDTVQFAYCVPYSYTRLTKFLSNLPNAQMLPSFKSLSGLSIPVVQITNEQEPQYNKRVILITGRVHPGQSNSSFVAEGIMEYLSSNQNVVKQLKKKFIFYIVPMMNPDGVVAGNYRTSLFGKDLNRTFDQSRKYAFPESYLLIQFVKDLKLRHKKRLSIYLDLHGHSVKKNVFMYGPDFSIQHSNYQISRQLPRLLGNITSNFRYYSCIFKISSEKSATARAILNRVIDIPFTYTMESSNGFFYDSTMHCEVAFTAKRWKQMGYFLCKGLNLLRLEKSQLNKLSSIKTSKQVYQFEKQPLNNQPNSDDDISQGKSDSEPEDEDLTEQQLKQIENKIAGKPQLSESQRNFSPGKDIFMKFSSKQLSNSKSKRDKHTLFLPPINSLNRALIFSNRHKKKDSIKQERLRNIESQLQVIVDKSQNPRFAMSQLVTDQKSEMKSSYNFKKDTKLQFFQRFKIFK